MITCRTNACIWSYKDDKVQDGGILIIKEGMYMRKISFLLLLLALTMTSLPGCKYFQKEEDSGAMNDEESTIPVEVQPVTTTKFPRERAYVGNVTASKMVKVIPLASEQILKYEWENGQYINQGEVVAEIRNAVSKKGVEALNAQMRSLDAQLGAAQREFKRVQSMYESNIVSRQNYDQAQDAVTTLQASKMQLQASIEQSRMGLNYSTVIAPVSGVISQKNSEVGDVASSAMPLCVLMVMDPLKVTLNVSEKDVIYLKTDQEIKLKFEAYPDREVIATIKRIMPYVNTSTRTNIVEAEFKNDCTVDEKTKTLNCPYKPGMYVRAEVNLETTENAIAVPANALLLDPELLAKKKAGGQTLRRAFVVKDDMKVEAREVAVGEQKDNLIEVLSNLNPGEKLVVRGQHSLKNGDKVSIKNSASKETASEVAEAKDTNAVNAPAAGADAAQENNEMAAAPAQPEANQGDSQAADKPSADAAPAANPKTADKAAAVEGT